MIPSHLTTKAADHATNWLLALVVAAIDLWFETTGRRPR